MTSEVQDRIVYKHKTTCLGTAEDFVAEVKREQKFRSPAALLQITRHANAMLKTEKYTRILRYYTFCSSLTRNKFLLMSKIQSLKRMCYHCRKVNKCFNFCAINEEFYTFCPSLAGHKFSLALKYRSITLM